MIQIKVSYTKFVEKRLVLKTLKLQHLFFTVNVCNMCYMAFFKMLSPAPENFNPKPKTQNSYRIRSMMQHETASCNPS